MIQMTIAPHRVPLNEECTVSLCIKNIDSALCTSLRLKFDISSTNLRLMGARELHIPLLKGNQVHTHKLSLKAIELGEFQLIPTFCSYRSSGRTHHPDLHPLTISVIEAPVAAPTDQQASPSSATQRNATNDTVGTSALNSREQHAQRSDQSRKNLSALRDVLATLYSDLYSIRRIVHDAGLDQARIDFHTNVINCWHAVLVEAQKNGYVDTLLDVVENEYGTNEDLQKAIDAFRDST
ncbi:MAG: hypothetical protein KDE19_18675 [Caldilineaceae bacterium]|nr:hypothetical protein [Caldilineaceae bacterium]